MHRGHIYIGRELHESGGLKSRYVGPEKLVLDLSTLSLSFLLGRALNGECRRRRKVHMSLHEVNILGLEVEI